MAVGVVQRRSPLLGLFLRDSDGRLGGIHKLRHRHSYPQGGLNENTKVIEVNCQEWSFDFLGHPRGLYAAGARIRQETHHKVRKCFKYCEFRLK